ncbi:MAG: prephenate dehydratase [Candidatus Omnitrophota bacterium]|nr:MAG: prephenate dehydratase [Candidatus Omnitrophota bacterium]
MEIRRIREKIDSIDKKIVELISKRAKLIKKIGEIKRKRKLSIYVPEREKEVYRKISQYNPGPLPDEYLKNIYREIMSASLALEKELTIAYLGPPATFTHLAALKKFGSAVKYTECSNITEIFTEVEKGNADFGVVPIENSIEGAVSHTLDMFIDSELKICSEVYLEITHYLLSRKKNLSDIRRVYSNPQVFGQCRRWLEKNIPAAELVEVSSTARAAQIAVEEPDSACIASRMAKDIYNLNILASSIEDIPYNITRFLVIGKTLVEPTGNDKTSIMFSVKDRVGALHAMLTPFKKYRINLTKIESRPSKRKVWDYYFFVDLEGHYKNSSVRNALAELEKQASYLKILGSYPKAEEVS